LFLLSKYIQVKISVVSVPSGYFPSWGEEVREKKRGED
jgi:hypothetical protein